MIQRENTSESFPITLIFPPQGQFTQPYLALPCLKAWLETHGFDDVEQRDLSVEAYDHFLTPAYLEFAARRVNERLPLESFAARETLGFEEMAAFRAAAESATSSAELIARIEGAKDVMRSERFFDAEQYLPATRTIYHALNLVSAAHFPSRLTPHNFTMEYSIEHSAETLAATRDEQQNPFLAYFRGEVLPGLIERRPRLVGLSVIYGSQLIPALTLGRLIHEALPDCHVTAGGGFLAYIGQKLFAAEGLDECLDSFIEHEGEAPLEGLACALRDGTPLSEIGSLTFFDRSSEEPRAVANERGHPIQLDTAPTPSFEGLPLEKYFSASPVLPYDINRGCYYSECTFCTLPTVIGPGFRTRSVKQIVDDVLKIKERYACSDFYFITDCMPPATMRELPRELIARDAGITWSCDARVERKTYANEGARTLYASGCRKLFFGFESATQRILDLMIKGQTPDDVTYVARKCHEAGISVTLYAMLGFPSETRAEAHATLDFLQRHADSIQEVSLAAFHIDEVADVYATPERYGLRILENPKADLQLYHGYEVETGLTQSETAELHEEGQAMLRECLPIFAGENVLYFMQKSHYFLHLARGVTPGEFRSACVAREAERAERIATPDLTAGDDLHFVDLPFSYSATRRSLSSPLAQAVRPENQTGHFDAAAEREASRQLTALPPEDRVLVYSGREGEFVELRPDGARALMALRRAGSLGSLRDSIDPALPTGQTARLRLTEFATHLFRLGLLHSSDLDS